LAVRFFCIRKKSVGTQNDEIREKYWFFVWMGTETLLIVKVILSFSSPFPDFSLAWYKFLLQHDTTMWGNRGKVTLLRKDFLKYILHLS
jgi:hypothetical protein